MKKTTLKIPNVLAAADLNRLAEKRKSREWLAAEIRSTRARVVFVFEDKVPALWQNDIPALATVSYTAAKQFIDAGNLTVFLGSDRGHSYFAVEVHNETTDITGDFSELRPLATLLNERDAAMFAYARAIMHWHRTHQYCGSCGEATVISAGGHERHCVNERCAADVIFPRTDPAIIVLVNRGDHCLLGRQTRWPEHIYSTIAGFVEPGESLEQAVHREVFEEAGVLVEDPQYHSSQPWPFPSSVMLGFNAHASSEKIQLHDGELADARWFSREDILSGLQDKTLRISSRLSIAYRLITDWYA
ncbi:MAG: NAD(+) diphosphatase, partial [Gammaproteobacteria bacterium]|nr:NAD(+) diphosphatase [Gammaproteobacteria bacterium]